MKTLWIVAVLTLLMGGPVPSIAGKPNCKLTIRTTYHGGEKRLQIDEVFTPSRETCREQARVRQKNEEPEEIAKISVSFSWRNPTY